MTTIIADATVAAFKSGRKTHTNSKGWIAGNAVCCIHNGETQDKRGRGGVIIGADGNVSWHCFNCCFKASYTPGYPLSHRFKRLMRWLNIDDSEIFRLTIEAQREQQRQELLGLVKIELPREELVVSFKKEPLPENAITFSGMLTFYVLKDDNSYPADYIHTVEYMSDRQVDMQKYDLYWSPVTQHKMNKRAIIPFTWKNEIIGYTARAINDQIIPKYIQHVDAGYVFNVDKQEKDWRFVLVCEGVIDAISVDGVAVLKAEVTEQQIDIIENLYRDIVVVPDFNKAGQKLIDVAINNGWSVAFPTWAETCEDINEAVVKYGKLFVLKDIVATIEHNPLKIQLLRNKYT